MASRRGFTLGEVLIVVAVLAILAGVLFPVFASARERGRATTCLSNVGQLARAQLLYAGENDDRLARGFRWVATLGLTRFGGDAPTRYGTDSVNVAVLVCPNRHLPLWPSWVPKIDGDADGGYAYNACLGRVSGADSPAHVVLIAESAWYERVRKGQSPVEEDSSRFTMQPAIKAPDEASAANQEMYSGNRVVRPVGEWGSRRHSGKGNYAFTDGHARSLAASAFYIPNRDHPCGDYSVSVTGAEDRLRFATIPFGSSLKG